MAHGHNKGTGTYIVVALILAVITYIEYWIVEFPPTWMDPVWILTAVVVMSIAKFWMVIWYFMHLKDDPKIYTGFFMSGMVIGLGTFVALMAMFLLPRAVAPVFADAPAVEHGASYGYGEAALSDEQRALIDSDGASRSAAERAATPRPRDGSLSVTPPAAPSDGFALRSDTQDDAADAVDTQAETAADDSAEATPVADAPDAIAADAASVAVFDVELGASTYGQCMGCHQPTGAGVPGAFPPLAGHAADLYRAEDGREYLIDVILYGLQGAIEVGGTTYNGIMPAFPNLSDEAIAAVLNHTLTEWGNADVIGAIEYISAAEVTAQRGRDLTRADVLELRQALVFASDEADEATDEPSDAAAAAAEAEAPAEATVSSADPTFDTALGASTYTNCVGCHQPTGAGIPGAFPPLVGHVTDLFNADGGRQYVIQMMLYGVQGPIVVNGNNYNGFMPGWQQLSDEAVAAVLNHTLTEWGNADLIDDFDAIRAAEVAAERGLGLSAGDVYQRRGELGLD